MVLQTTELNRVPPSPKGLRILAAVQLVAVLAVVAIAFVLLQWPGFAANGLPVLSAVQAPDALTWRIAAYGVVGILSLSCAAWSWARSPRPFVRMTGLFLGLSALSHLAQAFTPLDVEFLLAEVNTTAAFFNTLWWISGSLACLTLSIAEPKPHVVVLAFAAGFLFVISILEMLPGPMQALAGWVQLVIFAVCLEESVRLT